MQAVHGAAANEFTPGDQFRLDAHEDLLGRGNPGVQADPLQACRLGRIRHDLRTTGHDDTPARVRLHVGRVRLEGDDRAVDRAGQLEAVEVRSSTAPSASRPKFTGTTAGSAWRVKTIRPMGAVASRRRHS